MMFSYFAARAHHRERVPFMKLQDHHLILPMLGPYRRMIGLLRGKLSLSAITPQVLWPAQKVVSRSTRPLHLEGLSRLLGAAGCCWLVSASDYNRTAGWPRQLSNTTTATNHAYTCRQTDDGTQAHGRGQDHIKAVINYVRSDSPTTCIKAKNIDKTAACECT